MMNGDFGGFSSGSEAGYPGMLAQLSSLGLGGGEVESLGSPMSSPFAPDMSSSGLSSPFAGFGAGAASANFVPSESFGPFVGSPSMLAGAGLSSGIGSGFEGFPDAPAHMPRYPLHEEEELPRPYPMPPHRPPPRRPAVQQPMEYEQEQPAGGEEGSAGEEPASGPQYEQQSQPEQEAPQGYAGSQEAGGQEEQGYGRQPDMNEQGYQDTGPAQQRRGYQRSDYPRALAY